MHRQYIFSWTELLIAAVVFVLAVIVDRYWILSISNESKDLQQLEQQIKVKTQTALFFDWVYKGILVCALVTGVACYRNPALLNGWELVPAFISISTLILALYFVKSLKDKEVIAVEQLSLGMVKTPQIESLLQPQKGCSDKCKIKQKLTEIDLDRHRRVVDFVTNYVWCAQCQDRTTQGEVRCQMECGRQFYFQSGLLKSSFGKQQELLDQMNAKVERFDLSFQAYLAREK